MCTAIENLSYMLSRGLPVFLVPGVSVTLPSRRGDVRFTPLFLSRELLDMTAASVRVTIIL